MPRTQATSTALVVVPTMPEPVLLGLMPDAYKTGYSFFNDRWEGEDTFNQARRAALFWQGKGWTANVYEGEVEKWVACKKIKEPIFRVYLLHPSDKSLYAWWTPSDKEWQEPLRLDEFTWFELVKPEAKK